MLSSQNKKNSNSNEYGGIEDATSYVNTEYGSGWKELKATFISGIDTTTQAELEINANNCTIASIARIMLYYQSLGYSKIPGDIKTIYSQVRKIGVEHGYDPYDSGILRNLFVYTPWDIDNIVQDVWEAFGYPDGTGNNSYLSKPQTIKNNIDNLNPLLLNIASGYYKDHTVSVIGYIIFSKAGEKDKTFVQICDGWNKTVRYIDWEKFGNTLSSLTTFLPPKTK